MPIDRRDGEMSADSQKQIDRSWPLNKRERDSRDDRFISEITISNVAAVRYRSSFKSKQFRRSRGPHNVPYIDDSAVRIGPSGRWSTREPDIDEKEKKNKGKK